MKQYIIDVNSKLKNSCESFILPNGTVAYTDGLTFEEYVKSKPGIELKLIDENEMYKRFIDFEKSLQEPYELTTEEKYYEMLEVLPPRRWYKLSSTIFPFFVGEPFSGSLHRIYVYDKVKDKYYTAIRNILSDDDTILEDFLCQTN